MLTFYALLALVLVNFISNVIKYRGTDLIDMVNPCKILLLSYDRIYDNADHTLLFVQIYPLLAVCPACFAFLPEMHRKEDILLIGRIGAFRYYFCSLVSIFIVTAVVCMVPFLIEFAISCIAFPVRATGDIWGSNVYDPIYLAMIQRYLFPAIYHWNIYVYTFIGILLYGIFSGLLGMLTAALSMVFNIRYKVLLFLPVFILLNGTIYIKEIINIPFSVSWFDYILLFDDLGKSSWYLFGLFISIFAVSIFCMVYRIRGDHI